MENISDMQQQKIPLTPSPSIYLFSLPLSHFIFQHVVQVLEFLMLNRVMSVKPTSSIPLHEAEWKNDIPVACKDMVLYLLHLYLSVSLSLQCPA